MDADARFLTRWLTTGDGQCGRETICVFDIDAEGHAALHSRLAGHEGEIWAVAMASTGEGRHFYTGSKLDGTTRLWEIPDEGRGSETRYHVQRAIEFEDGTQSLVGWSKNDGFIRTDLESGEIKPISSISVPEAVAGEPGFRRPNAVNTRIARGARMAQGDQEGISIWNLITGEEEVVLPEAGRIPKPYRKLPFAFSPDGSLLATANETNGIRVWDCSDWTHRELVPDFAGRAELCFSADNRVLVALPPDENTKGMAVEIASGRVLVEFELSGMGPELAVSSDGKFLAIGSTAKEVQLWDLENGEKVHELKGHVAGIRGFAFTPDGRTLATCGDQRLKLWNVETGSELIVLARSVVEIGSPMFSPDGRTLVAHAADGYLRVWRVPSREEIESMEFDGRLGSEVK